MGILDRFRSKIEKWEGGAEAANKRQAEKERLKAERKKAFRDALQKERVELAKKRGAFLGNPLKGLKTTGKELRGYQKQVAKRNKLKGKEGFSFAGPNVATPKDKDLYEVKDFRK